MSNAQVNENARCVNLPRATGADIPEELFEHILWRLETPQWTRGQGYPPSGNSVVYSLTSLSLVSKYFARICRPKLYQNVSMHSQAQLARLLGLLDGGCAPLGKPLVAFTEFIHIDSREDGIPWAHRIATVLLPRIKSQSIGLLRHVTFKTNKVLAGLVPTQVDLPRTLPPSLFQDVVQLELHDVLFKRGEDLMRCVSSFRGVQAMTLRTCACEVSVQRITFPRISRSPKWYSISLDDSRTTIPMMLLVTLDVYARHNSVAFFARDQAEAQAFVDIVILLYDRMLTSHPGKYTRINTSNVEQYDVEVGTTDHGPSSQEGTFVRANLRLQDKVQYNLTIRIHKLPTRDASVDSPLLLELWRELAGCTTRLLHLRALKIVVESLELMETFVRVVHPALQEMCSTGLKIEFGLKVHRYFDPPVWEPVATVLERFSPAPPIEAPAEGEETNLTAEVVEDRRET